MMPLTEINAWWKRALKKEIERNTNTPMVFKGDRSRISENFSHFAPPLKPLRKETDARRR